MDNFVFLAVLFAVACHGLRRQEDGDRRAQHLGACVTLSGGCCTLAQLFAERLAAILSVYSSFAAMHPMMLTCHASG